MPVSFNLFPVISRFSITVPGAAQSAASLLGNPVNVSGRTRSVYDLLFAQKIIGDDESEVLTGSRYADALYGQGGNDILLGGLGNDTYHFGRGGGEDQIFDAGGWDTIVLAPDIGLADVIIGRVVDLQESDGDGVFVAIDSGIGEPEFIFSHAAHDIEAIRFADGTTVSDALLDALMATNQTYFGTGGNDNALGGDGVDYLHGRAGDDVLCGDRGNDTMIGGPGNDTYVFSAGDGFDQIVDIQGDHDVLMLNGIDPDMVQASRTFNDGLMLDFGAKGGIFIQGDIEEICFIGTDVDAIWTADDIAELGG
ncbi:MAG: hypothetical protein LBK55_10715 [Azoarcus sp.]|jgi:Ca2+-binding RTX toxin-like protein|nr:hypothetical protein [Azoarcus sp.]